jgi:hypothetical protein
MPDQNGADSRLGIGVRGDIEERVSCDSVRIGGFAMTERSAREVCERAKQYGGVSFLKLLVHNIPKRMFAFLPLLATVMPLFY